MLATDPKKGTIVFEFYNGDKWVSLTKQTTAFLTSKTLKNGFVGGKCNEKLCRR